MESAIPDIPRADLWDFLFERQDKPFADDQVIFKSPTTDEVRTYAGLRAEALNFGSNLKAQWGWQKGDVLLVFSPNSIDIPALLWGCHWAEGIVSPSNPAYSIDEFKYQVVDSEAKAMAVHSSCLTIAISAAKLVGFPLDRILVFGEDSASGTGLRHISSMMEERSPGMTRTPLDPSCDPAFLVYSSGTTGRPKGAMVTHLNVVASMVLQRPVEAPHMDWRATRILALLPMYHIYGLVCLVHFPVYMGIQTTVMQKFSVSAFSEYVRNDAITHVYVAPPVVLYLAKDPGFRREDLMSVKMITSGGAPLAPELIRAVHERLNIPVRQAFGLTESTAVCHIQRWNQWDRAMGSNGPPLVGVEVKFIDEEGNPIAEGEGELCMRGPTIFRGYHKNQAATEAALTQDGWFKTGDIGHQDKDGNLYITDRIKDLIKFKGYQVPPTEIEGVLHEHHLVDDVSVIGVFNQDIASEVPLAYVVLRKTVKSSNSVAQELISHVASRLAVSKRLRGGIVWSDQIPKSGSGKILKRVLKDRAETVDKGKAVGAMMYDKFIPAKL